VLWTLTMDAWRILRPVVTESHRLNEEQDPDPHINENWIRNAGKNPKLSWYRNCFVFRVPIGLASYNRGKPVGTR
jgi:hypothetical protein